MQQAPPAAPGDREEAIDTPALVIDLDAFEGNLARMAELLRGTKARLRAHAKTHKCAVIAHLQMKAGAVGQCVQKVAEAEALGWAGVPDILVSNEVVGAGKIARLVALARIARVGVCVDDAGEVAVLEAAAEAAGIRLSVLVEIDVGAGRCGVAPGPEAVALAQRIAGSAHLQIRWFAGVPWERAAYKAIRGAGGGGRRGGFARAADGRAVEAGGARLSDRGRGRDRDVPVRGGLGRL